MPEDVLPVSDIEARDLIQSGVDPEAVKTLIRDRAALAQQQDEQKNRDFVEQNYAPVSEESAQQASEFSQYEPVDITEVWDAPTLAKDKNFSLEAYVTAHPEVLQDNAKVAKLSEVWKEKLKEPITAGDVAIGAAKLPWTTLKHLYKFTRGTGQVLYDTVSTPLASAVGAATGQGPEFDEALRQQSEKRLSEDLAGLEQGTFNFASWLARAKDTLPRRFGVGSWDDLTPEQLQSEFRASMERTLQGSRIGKGEGEFSQAVGGETLREVKERGEVLDEERVAKVAEADPVGFFLFGQAFRAGAVPIRASVRAVKGAAPVVQAGELAALRTSLNEAKAALPVGDPIRVLAEDMLTAASATGGVGTRALSRVLEIGQSANNLLNAQLRARVAADAATRFRTAGAQAASDTAQTALKTAEQAASQVLGANLFAKIKGAANSITGQTAGQQALGGALQVAGGALQGAARVAEAVPAVAGAVTGAALVAQGNLLGGLGAFLGAKPLLGRAAAAAGRRLRGVGEALSDVGAQVRSAAPQTGFQKALQGLAQGSGEVVAEGLKGTPLDVGFALALAETPEEVQNMAAYGAAFRALHAAGQPLARFVRAVKAGAQAPAQGAFIPPTRTPIRSAEEADRNARRALSPDQQKWIQATEQFLRDTGSQAPVYVLPDANAMYFQFREQFVRRNGREPLPIEEEHLLEIARVRGVHQSEVIGDDGQVGGAIFVLDPTAAPHEAKHAFQEVLGENGNKFVDQIIFDEFRGNWESIGRDYTERLTGIPGGNWRQNLQPFIGQSIRREAGGDPTIAANITIAREVAAEQFATLFSATGGKPQAPTTLTEKLANVVDRTAKFFGVNLLRGLRTPGLEHPVSSRVQEEIRGRIQEAAGQARTPGAAPEPAPLPPTPLGQPTGGAQRPAPAPAPVTNLREPPITPAIAEDFQARTPERLNINAAREWAAQQNDPEISRTIQTIGDALQRNPGEPVVFSVENFSVVPSKQEAAYTRTIRRAEQAVPEAIRDFYRKRIAVTRFLRDQFSGANLQLAAMSLDKVLTNVFTLQENLAKRSATDLTPYEVDPQTGQLTEPGWRALTADLISYTTNQANGYRGDGREIVRTPEMQQLGVAIPEANPSYRPTVLPERVAQYLNVIQGVNIPLTAREFKGVIPGNVKGQVTREAQGEQVITPSDIAPRRVAKQAFKSFPGREVREVNPLRDEMTRRGVNTRELLETTERLNVDRVRNAKPEFNVRWNLPVTDIIRAGFLPDVKQPGGRTKIDDLPSETKGDIVSWLHENVPALKDREFYELRDNLLELADPVMLERRSVPLRSVRVSPGREVSELAVSKFSQQPGSTAPPIVVAGGKLLEGGHRLAAAKRRGDATIEAVDIDPLLKLDWDAWLRGETRVGFPVESQFLPGRALRDQEGRRVEAAAFRLPNGEIVTGPTHFMALLDAVNAGKIPRELLEESVGGEGLGEDGFVDTQGNFLTRQEAFDLSKQAGQLSEEASQRRAFSGGELESTAFAEERAFLPNDPRRKLHSWIGPSGEVFPVEKTHSQDARKLPPFRNARTSPKDPLSAAFDRGFFRVTFYGDELIAHNESKNLTPRQEKELVDLAIEHGLRKVSLDLGERGERVVWTEEESGQFLPRSGQFLPKAKRKDDTRSAIDLMALEDWTGRIGGDLPAKEGAVAIKPRTLSGQALAKKGFKIEVDNRSRPSTEEGDFLEVMARKGKDVVGLLSINRDEVPGRGKVASVSMIEVLPEFQRQGIAEALMREGATILQREGIRQIDGTIVDEGPVQIRERVFGPGVSQFTRRGQEVTAEEAKRHVARGGAIRAVSAIAPDQQFLPRTSAGKELEKKGFEFVPEFRPASVRFRVKKDGEVVGNITATIINPGSKNPRGFIAAIDVEGAFQRQGIGEALTREVAAEFQERGIEKISGHIVGEGPVQIRERVFGPGNTKFTTSTGDVSASRAKELLEGGALGVIAESKVEPGRQFLPKKERREGPAKVTAAAIRFPNGEIYTGVAHFDALDNAASDGALGRNFGEEVEFDTALDALDGVIESGFVDANGDYLTREQAFERAKEIRQIPKKAEERFYETGAGKGLEAEAFEEVRKFLPERKDEDLRAVPLSRLRGGPESVSAVKVEKTTGRLPERPQEFLQEALTPEEFEAFSKRFSEVNPGVKGLEFQALPLSAEELKAALEEVPRLHKENGGATYQVRSKAALSPGDPVYVVSPFTERSRKLQGPDLSSKELHDFMETNSDLLELPMHGVGSWFDSASGTTFLDVVVATKSRDLAVKLGELYNQKAIWDMGQMAEVPTGGTGEKKEFSTPETERLQQAAADLGLGIQFLPKKKKTKVTVKVKSREPKHTPKKLSVKNWLLPDGRWIENLGGFHENWLAENADQLNKKFGTDFKEEADPDERIKALRSGFTRFAYDTNTGTLTVEANTKRFDRQLKDRIFEVVAENLDDIDNVRVSVVNDKGEFVNGGLGRLFNYDGPERLEHIPLVTEESQVRRTEFMALPKQKRAPLTTSQISEMSKDKLLSHFPEVFYPKGGGQVSYDILNSDRAAKYYGPPPKGKKTPTFDREGAVNDFADELVKRYQAAESLPETAMGRDWYENFFPILRERFGNDAGVFAEILAATSPNTPPSINFLFAERAYKQWKSGALDKTIAKYEEGLRGLEDGSTQKVYEQDVPEADRPKKISPATVMAHWIEKHDLLPRQKSGKKFGFHGAALLRVFTRRWLQDAGPKTSNFVKNLTGEGSEATIDVWAARTMRSLGYEGFKPRWRLLPRHEKGISDLDFQFSQEVFHKAAKKLGLLPRMLQGAMWFAEKVKWFEEGWSRLDLGDFKTELDKLIERERNPSPEQSELFGEDDIQPRD